MHQSPDTNAQQLFDQARNLFEAEQYLPAIAVLKHALNAWLTAQQLTGVVDTLQLLAFCAFRLKQPLEARQYLLEAIEYSRQNHDQTSEATLMMDVGTSFALVGETAQAVEWFQRAYELRQQLKDFEGAGRALYTMGKTYFEAGANTDAIRVFQQAFPLLKNTASWTEDVAHYEQLVQSMLIADTLLGRLNQPKSSSKQKLADAFASLQDVATNLPIAQQLLQSLTGMRAALDSMVNQPIDYEQQAIQNVADENPQTRLNAVYRLQDSKNPAAIAPLFQLLQRETDPKTISLALEVVLQHDPASIEPHLRQLQHHEQPQQRSAAMLGLIYINVETCSPALWADLAQHDPVFRAKAIEILALKRVPDLQHHLADFLRDQHPKVRSQAIYALKSYPTIDLLDDVLQATRDRYQVVRWAAVRTLGDLKDQRATMTLVAALKDSNRDVRLSAAAALGKLKDPRAVAGLTDALLDDWYRVVESAAATLKKMKANPALEQFVANLEHPDKNHRAATILKIAQHYDTEPARIAIRHCLNDAEVCVRFHAAKILTQWGDPTVIPVLINEIKQDEATWQQSFIQLASHFIDPELEITVIRLLEHPDPYIRYEAIQALERTGTREALPALARVQLHDDTMVQVANGWKRVNLKHVAAEAKQVIQRRIKST